MGRKKQPPGRIRNGFLVVHRWLGLVSGIVVIVVALTGCLYVFEKECREIFQRKYLYVEAQATPRKSFAELQSRITNRFPKEKITGIRFRESNNAAFLFTTKSRKIISVNPYSGDIVGTRNMDRDFFTVVLRLHRTLLLGETGKQIIRWNVLIFFILCISGLVLWWPKQKRFLKQALSIKWRSKNWKRLNWDLHSVFGFYALLILAVISLTGLFWVFDSVKDLVKITTGQSMTMKQEKLKSRVTKGVTFPLDAAYTELISKYSPGRETIIQLPPDSIAPLRMTIEYPYTLMRKQNALYFDQYSGEILRQQSYKDYTAYEKVNRSNYQLHTGDMPGLGIGTKIVYFLASLIAASLPVTGLLLWLGKRRKSRKTNAVKLQTSKRTLPVSA